MVGFIQFSFPELYQLPPQLPFLSPCHLFFSLPTPIPPSVPLPGSLLLGEFTAALDRSFCIDTCCNCISPTPWSPLEPLVHSEKMTGVLEYDI